MTVAVGTGRSATWAADGTNRSWDFPFKVLRSSHVLLEVTDAGGFTSEVSGPFTVMGLGDDNGGSVVYPIAPAEALPAGYTVRVVRQVPLEQPSRIGNQGGFHARTHEDTMDLLAQQIQQLHEDGTARDIRAPFDDGVLDMHLSGKTIRAGRLLEFDAGGKPATIRTAAEIVATATAETAGLTERAETAADRAEVLTQAIQDTPPFNANLALVTQDGTGAVARSVAARLKDVVNVMDFGAVGDGTTNDTPAFQAAANSFGGLGGRIEVPHRRFLIDTNLSLPRNVTVQGPHRVVGSIPTNNLKGVLLVNSAATITLGQGAGLAGLFVFRKGMSFPVATSSAFAGTAVTAGGNDPFVTDCMIAGFNKGFVSSGFYRPKLQNLMLDNNNGIDISNSPDAVYLDTIHCWPFATVEAFWTAVPGASLDRLGTAFLIHDIVDWPRLTNCFCFCYTRGFVLSNRVNSARLSNCGTDGDPTNVDSIGYLIEGDCNDTVLTGCQSAAARKQGVAVNVLDGAHVKLIGCDVWGGVNTGIEVLSGDATILGCTVRDKGYGVLVAKANSRVHVDFTRFLANVTDIDTAVATSRLRIGTNNMWSATADGTMKLGTNIGVPSVASAAAVSLPNHGETFKITGTTSFANLFAGWAGRRVTLLFDGALTVTIGGATPSGMKLNGNANFVTQAGSSLTLVHDGSFWIETGRKT